MAGLHLILRPEPDTGRLGAVPLGGVRRDGLRHRRARAIQSVVLE
jgi:hypothetical protein